MAEYYLITIENTGNEAAKAIMDDVKALERLAEMFAKGAESGKVQSEVSENSEQKNNTHEGGKASVDDLILSQNEIDDIQNINNKTRTSVNDFSAHEINIANKWAKYVYNKLGINGTKSPFFRAWFGDWRANDKTKVKVANKKGVSRGVVVNEDTGWEINVSANVFNETKSNNGIINKFALSYLSYINDIVKKAIFLDTISLGGRRKSINSLFMHSFYVVADIGNGKEMLKLTVEEMYNPNIKGTNKRAYELVDIEKALTASVRVQANNPSSLTNTVNAIDSVSDLFSAVKLFDKKFSPQNASKVVNADGTPKVLYHQTGKEFYTFETKAVGAGEEDTETPNGIFMKPSDEDIGIGGDRQMALYACIKNPLEVKNRSELVEFYNQNVAGYKSLTEKLNKITAHYEVEYAKEEERTDKWYDEHYDEVVDDKYTEEELEKILNGELGKH